MLDDQHKAFIRTQEKRQKQFEDGLQTKKDIMRMQDLEDNRQSKREIKACKEAADTWELKCLAAFARQEKEREKNFMDAEIGRDQTFLKASQDQQSIFVSALSAFQDAFFGLLNDLENKAYEHEGIRLRNILNWSHVKRDEVKVTLRTWERKFKDAEVAREAKFARLLESVDA